jgi:hypothetical protein
MALTDNLLAYWDLSESSGNPRLDSVGANDLSDNNGIATGTGPGGSGVAADLEASSFEYLQTAGDHADISCGDTDFTINLWVNFETGGAFKIVATKGYGYTTNYEWSLFTDTNSKLQFSVNSGAATTGAVSTTGAAVSTATWYMVTMWHDSVAGSNNIGIAVNAGTADTATHLTGVNDGTRALELGRTEGGALYFDGKLAYVGMWRRVLSGAERTSLYNSGAGLNYAGLSGGGGATVARQRLVNGGLVRGRLIG